MKLLRVVTFAVAAALTLKGGTSCTTGATVQSSGCNVAIDSGYANGVEITLGGTVAGQLLEIYEDVEATGAPLVPVLTVHMQGVRVLTLKKGVLLFDKKWGLKPSTGTVVATWKKVTSEETVVKKECKSAKTVFDSGVDKLVLTHDDAFGSSCEVEVKVVADIDFAYFKGVINKGQCKSGHIDILYTNNNKKSPYSDKSICKDDANNDPILSFMPADSQDRFVLLKSRLHGETTFTRHTSPPTIPVGAVAPQVTPPPPDQSATIACAPCTCNLHATAPSPPSKKSLVKGTKVSVAVGQFYVAVFSLLLV